MTFLLGLLNKPIHSEKEMMLHFLQLQLMGNFLSVACGIVSPSSVETRQFFFSSHVDDAVGGKNSEYHLLLINYHNDTWTFDNDI